jgi:RimJ/RimL family protein N-acetyltransferase
MSRSRAQFSVSRACSRKMPTHFLATTWRSVGCRRSRRLASTCYVVVLDGAVVGFAAIRGNEFLHFGTAVEHWGTGIAQTAHDAVLDRMRIRGVQRAWLRVFAGNARGRRFYEKLDWHLTGERTKSSYPAHPELLLCERSLEQDLSGRS